MRDRRRFACLAAFCLLLLASAVAARAQGRAEDLPPELANVGIDEKLDAKLPLELEFSDHDGRKVRLGDYFDGRRPVVLTLNYYKCPMLCGLMLNGMTDALKELEWTAGQNFRVVTVSFDPLETPQLANLKRQNYLREYGRAEAAAGWDFLVGRKASVEGLLNAAGYRIAWNEQRQEWMHAAALIVCTPDGRISRYLYGIVFEPRTVRLSLVEASEGKVGSTVDRLLLFCYHYDPQAGSYALAAWNVVRGAGLLTLVVVAVFLIVLWRRERRRDTVVLPSP